MEITLTQDIIPKYIPINKSSPTNKKYDNYLTQYELKQNCFDPTKKSPPNNFLKNLEKRLSIYNFEK
jgi:hypothetical protein